MSVYFRFLRICSFPSLLLGLVSILVLFLGGESSRSKLLAASKCVNNSKELVTNENQILKVAENVRKTTLKNGLTLITKEVHTAPVVSVQVWYKVGTRNEKLGVNGIAHQLEHMMFKGTKRRPVQFGKLFSALGSDSNAFTSHDQTVYYGTAERNKLKALLTLEADRMQNSVINTKQLNSEKQVVISELKGYENSPQYRLNRAVMQAAFPNHPYGLPVGGTEQDVEKFTLEQVQQYYENFYSPNNAVLVIVGDFETNKTIEAVKEIFGEIPANKNTQLLNKIAEKNSFNASANVSNNHKPIVLRQPGSAPLFQAVYRLPYAKHRDIPALDVMDYILAEGRNSRLYQALVNSGKASDVSASVISLQDAGWYELLVTANSTSNLSKITSIVNREISHLAHKEITSDELNRAKAQLEASVILSNRDITSLAMQLGNDETTTGDYTYTDRYLAAIQQVTVEDVQRVAQKYLKQQSQIAGFFKPTDIAAKDKTENKQVSPENGQNFSKSTINNPDVIKYLPPVDSTIASTSRILPEKFRLPNGLEILLLPDKSTSTVTLGGYIKAGSEFDPENKAGLASLVADNLMNGTKNKDVLSLAKTLEDCGVSLDFKTYREGMYLEGNSLSDNLSVLVKTLGDVIKNPTFPSKQLQLSRQQALTALKQDLDDPQEVAQRTFLQAVFPKTHPSYSFSSQQSLQRITRQDVVKFQKKHYRPDTTVLALVGNFQPDQVKKLLEKEFGDWKGTGDTPKVEYPPVNLPEKIIRFNPVVPGKVQAITFMGNKAINRQDPRYYAAKVLNHILGGDTLSSRLGSQIRDRLGLTYGIYSNFLAGKNSGTFLIEMQTSSEDTMKAIANTRQLLEDMHNKGVTATEVETAKRNLIGNYNVSLASPDELTYRIIKNHVLGLSTDEIRSYTEKIQAVTSEQVNQAARELLHPDKIVVVTAGPPVLANQRKTREQLSRSKVKGQNSKVKGEG
ncbi:peptidase M16 domain-containing protein [Calothrix parasitica NIES-267]|uniref:Peptidase M16 domain-containing protein n=1 Tax=Calothrix parasitica NIES-267 TaxID=1973488 RepID=A0A1Z4LWA2_9CYAN|nr:peptidase M16 domain-containing protein [Calothrix parasitica NIES-267]